MFDRYVADKKRKRPLLYIAFVVSTVVEAALILFFIIYSFINVDEVQPPPLTVQFFATAPPPPPPPPPPKAAAKKQVTPPKVVKPVMQPTEVPKFIQPKTDPDPPEEKDTGGGEGVEGGVEGGVPGGVVGSSGPPPPKEEPKPPPKPKIVPAIMIKKDALRHDDPHLPDVVKAQRRGSTVTGQYKVCIGQNGSISSVDIMQGIPGADDSIISTIKGWLYKPQQIPICFVQYLEFQIE